MVFLGLRASAGCDGRAQPEALAADARRKAMKHLLAVIVLSIILAGCAGGTSTTQQPSSAAAGSKVPPTQVPTASIERPGPAASPSEPAAPTGLIAYWKGSGGIRVINSDGTDERELLPGVPDEQDPLAWSADGSRLLYKTAGGFGLTDAAGSEPQEFKIHCPAGGSSNSELRACQADETGVALSPDGGRLAYSVGEGSFDQAVQSPTAAMVILDIATGRVTRLESTIANGATCGGNHSPAWSPDGKRLAFVRAVRPTSGFTCPEAILTVDVDHGEVRQLVGPGQAPGQLELSWSPDGSRVLVDGFVNLVGDKRNFATDLYTVRSDGTDFHALSNDQVSSLASWTRDQRIVFTRWRSTADTSRGDLWVMDADGANATKLETTIPALTAAGCLICRYPAYSDGIDPFRVRETSPLKRYGSLTLLWQP